MLFIWKIFVSLFFIVFGAIQVMGLVTITPWVNGFIIVGAYLIYLLDSIVEYQRRY